ncbi:MAG: DUF2804 domain-containing protein [Treponema sp.]|jgi:hypothetical protein|nr:DUF2804 domain-containing protein [Treponema sp.]
MAQKEISSLVPVLDELGLPVNFGWSRNSCFIYDPAFISAPRRFVCESDRYILISPSHLIILEILDDGFLGYIGMSVVSLRDTKRSTQMYRIPFPLGTLELPRNSDTGSIRLQHKKYFLNFAAMEGGVRIIKVDIPKFGHHRNLRGELVLSPPQGAESLATSMPWRERKHAFRCTRRSPWYIAEGVIQFGTQELIFTQGNSWGIFDWSRGVRPPSDLRYWASGCGQSGGKQVGFSVGYDSADSSLGTANAFFLDGKLHKLDQVSFHISPSNWFQPWRFTSSDNRLEMIFALHQERAESHQMLFQSLKRRQACGFFSGRVILDDGSEFEFQNITGFAERRKTRF